MEEQLSRVVSALSKMRAPRVQSEYDLHALAEEALESAGLSFSHEAPLQARSRIDLMAGRIGIELKRTRPAKKALLRQLEKYAAHPAIDALIAVLPVSMALPVEVSGKPLVVISLQALWGVALHEKAGTPAPEARSARAVIPPVARSAPGEPAAPPCAPIDEGRLPSYLVSPREGSIQYGTVSYNRKRKCWTIKAEPMVMELAKRLFPGSAGGKRGVASFTSSSRAVSDMNWLMLRYPMEIAARDRELWEKALHKARERALRAEAFRLSPPKVSLADSGFTGTLRMFQENGLSFLFHTERCLLADEMGLGKTVQALACLAALKAFPALIVVPPHLVRNWENEIRRFLTIGGRAPRVHVLRGLRPEPLPEADLYLCHYLLLRGWKQVLPEMGLRTVVFDEIQELRHAGTEKYSAASLLSEAAERVMGLSGTPIYNNGGEIWNVVNILDYHFLGDWESFTREWCYGYGNNIVIKPELLGEYLRREGLMLRRTKADVLPELPDKRRVVQSVEPDSKQFTQLMRPVLSQLKRWKTESALSASERALLEDHISQGERQATGLAKAPQVCQFVRALLEGEEKVLLFAHHHLVMDTYKKELRAFSPVFITGRETAAGKMNSVDRFMSGKTDLCVISLRAASGLNLQRATCVVFGELDWSPAVHSQAEDRAHRIGQKDSLLCYYLVSAVGSDAMVQDALGLKVSQFSGLMNEAPAGDEAVLSENRARRHVEQLSAEWEREIRLSV